MEVFVARHPVFDSNKEVYGYELEFRRGFDAYYEALESEKESVDLMAFVNFSELTDGKKGFVSFSRGLLLINFPVLFDHRAMIATIPGDMKVDEEILARCAELKQLGYTLAVNDFTEHLLGSPFLEYATYVGVDFATVSPEVRRELCERLAGWNVQAIARNLATYEEFDEAVRSGYKHFHGEFFSKPLARPNKKIAANKLTYLQLVKEVNAPSLSYDDIANLIERDVAMTYRLLRFMNSAWFGLRFEVRSVKHALVLLGPKEIRRWATMVAVRNTGDDKPEELLLRSLTRAKAAEQIAELANMPKEAPEMFLMGMFSVIDALTDKPMEEILEKLPLKDQIKQALVGGTGVYRNVYDTVVAYEQGDWDLFSTSAAALGIEEAGIPKIFRSSMKWAGEALREM
ncbi:MAG: HDOD domain-containing protein [Planctomycetes bacterium]|nr:HDOD domain-containing protein [Planctomycetota bacterium]